jgi:hypothetical protein
MGCNPENMERKSFVERCFENWLRKNYTKKDTGNLSVLFTKEDMLLAYKMGYEQGEWNA